MLVNNEGHIKLTDFGLSHIALLEDVTSNTNYPRKQSEASDTKSGSPSSNNPSPAGGGDNLRESTLRKSRRPNQRIVGTPDYLVK